MILAPLRGVTVRAFRETYADALAAAGFTEAFTPFIPALAGCDPAANAELKGAAPASGGLKLTPQFIGKDPGALRACLRRIRDLGFDTADLNAGCPVPMVRNQGRGAGLLRTPDVLRRMLEAGCETMGEGRFSLKVRLGVDRADELLALMPLVNGFPLRFLTVHARTARQMYAGACDRAAFAAVCAAAKVEVVENGDLDWRDGRGMVGRSFIRDLGLRPDAGEVLRRYAEVSRRELRGDRPALGRMKELVSYWKELPPWRRRWDVVKICRTVDELASVLI